jgi:hypothetical protein
MRLADDAVYTIRHPQELAAIVANRKPATLRENKRWVTAKTLFEAARKQDDALVVIYADAAHDCSKLICWGTLTQIDVDATGTSYTVANLSPLSHHRTQELVLRSPRNRHSEPIISIDRKWISLFFSSSCHFWPRTG